MVRAHGYTPVDPAQYNADQTLRVLIGQRGGPSAHVQRAFFFVNGDFIGTDTKAPSADILVVAQEDTEITLAYAIYTPTDQLCCPSGGDQQVRYQLDNGQLVPQDPVPPVSRRK